jgi:AraC-like DNA-binding protein
VRPYLEALPPDPAASCRLLHRRLDNRIPFEWHHHPEFELTLTLSSTGQRFVGDHVGRYGDGDLVLLGPNLPHTWSSEGKLRADEPHVALVAWLGPDWLGRLGASFVELRAVDDLLARAGRGLRFSPEAAEVRPRLEALHAISAAERLIVLLGALQRLAANAAEPLASTAPGERAGTGRERIDRVLTHLHEGYARPVSLRTLAEVAALSPSGLHRLFRRHAGMPVSEYLTRLRVGDACARLSGTDQPIAHVAEAVGYASLANFNRQFRALKAMTPREYRRLFRQRGR